MPSVELRILSHGACNTLYDSSGQPAVSGKEQQGVCYGPELRCRVRHFKDQQLAKTGDILLLYPLALLGQSQSCMPPNHDNICPRT